MAKMIEKSKATAKHERWSKPATSLGEPAEAPKG